MSKQLAKSKSELNPTESPMLINQIPEMRRIQRVHFIGIGGSGMCGIAEVIANQGYQVSGSDVKSSETTASLNKQGIEICIGHHAKNIKDADVVVVSTAIDQENPELLSAREQLIPIVRRAEMLAELMRHRHSIAVAGTHGKTTTTSMLVSILAQAKIDPTFVIGGLVKQTSTNAKLGTSRYMVAEADESDASFLHLQPMVAIVTNIDDDHMSTYNNDFSQLTNTFVSFLHNLPFYGLAVICIDDGNAASILNDVSRPVLTYGFNDNADFRITDCSFDKHQSWFTVHRPDSLSSLNIEINVPGKHNVLNATAAIVVATDEKVNDQSIVEGLKYFKGVGRRFEILGHHKINTESNQDIMLVDDYGHHPSEMEAVINSIRSGYADRRIVMIFQPHRYTRTRDLFDEFVQVLSRVDCLVVTEVYSAGEPPISKADSKSLCSSIRQLGKVDPILVKNLEDIPELIGNLVQPNDLVITQGAGSVNTISRSLNEWFEQSVINARKGRGIKKENDNE